MEMEGVNDDESQSSPVPTVTPTGYQRIQEAENVFSESIRTDNEASRSLWNFILMSALFSANHASVVSCLSLATPRLGETGAWQSGILYLMYTGSALAGATWIVKKLGGRNGMVMGMLLYCIYVGCFWLVTVTPNLHRLFAYTGAAIGGVGAGFLWTAQGSYFSKAAEDRSTLSGEEVSTSTSYLAGIFAFIYLGEEVLFKIMSSVLIGVFQVGWSTIYAIYSLLAIGSTAMMVLFVQNYPTDSDSDGMSDCHKLTAAWRLLRKDPKMPYMIGLNAAFGFTSSFLNSYVNGEVVRTVLNDPNSEYIGYLTSWVSIVAAAMSLVFGRVSETAGNGRILYTGAVCFALVAAPFLLQPNLTKWGISSLLLIYTFHGVGRATFESTLKATFADYFSYEREGAFANIILQNGLSSAIGYFLTFGLKCLGPSFRCTQYHDGSFHDVFSFEVLVVTACVLGIFGFWRASQLHHAVERDTMRENEAEPLDNEL